MENYYKHSRPEQTISAKEAIGRELHDLEVPANTEIQVAADEEEHQKYFSHIKVSSFHDRQLLGFIPRKMSEEKIKDVIARDDEEAHKFLATGVSASLKKCDCESHGLQTNTSFAGSLRRTYNSIRKHYHPNLARMISDHINVDLAWDSPVAGMIRKWAVLRHEVVITALFANDIIINKNAVLAVNNTTSSLFARDILIHKTGKLVSQPGYLKIWANAIAPLPLVIAQDSIRIGDIPWRQ